MPRPCSLAEALAKVKGVKILSQSFFNEFAVTLPKPAAEVVEALAEKGILAGVPASRFYPSYPELAEVLLVTATETNSEADIAALAKALRRCCDDARRPILPAATAAMARSKSL